MTEETDTKDGAISGRKLIRLSESVPTYYINNTEVGMTSWDVNLRLARIVKADAEALYVRDEALVTMSLHHAKAVALILASYIGQYENVHGPLTVPIPGAGMAPGQGEGKFEVELPTSMFPDSEESETETDQEKKKE